MTDEEITQELKAKGLPVFGTRQEKSERLKKHYGIQASGNPQNLSQDEGDGDDKCDQGQQQQVQAQDQKQQGPTSQQAKKQAKDLVVDNIEKIEKQRQRRRQEMEEKKQEKIDKEAQNKAKGKNVDVDFETMMDKCRFKDQLLQNHTQSKNVKLCVCVRKRPIFKKEQSNGEIDSVSCANPSIRIHAPKFKVDGITKYIDNFDFTFDNTFNENEETSTLYEYTLRSSLESILNRGVITCFAYGQTGSGKTYTMVGMENYFVNDLFHLINNNKFKVKVQCYISFFEIYGGRLYDLLNNKQQLQLLEDKNNNVQLQGITEKPATDADMLVKLIQFGHSVRTTHQTVSNDTSSRSHAICSIIIKDEQGGLYGKLVLVDLAGSERAQDCQSNNRQRRIEGAEINKSLLALKECIRAMDQNQSHIPFRASKLTLVLRDSFIAKNNTSRVIMIACISPGSSSAEHSLNTLRYADRLKENKPIINKVQQGNNAQPQNLLFSDPPQLLKEKKEDIPIQKQKPPIPLQLNKEELKQAAEQPASKEVFSQKQSPSNQGQQSSQNEPKKTSFHKQPSPRQSKENIKVQNKIMPSPKHQQQPQQSSRSNGTDKEKDNKSPSSEDELQASPQVKGIKDDVRCMRETLKMEQISNEFFDFHEKVNTILVEQEEIFVTHMAAIKEDAKLLTAESELISNVQGVGFMDYDIDLYATKLESIIKKKLKMYSVLNKKLGLLKEHLKEEEEIHSKVKETFYY